MLTKGSNTKVEIGKKRDSIRISIFQFSIFSLLHTLSTNAQCAMCRAVLTSEGNKTKAEAVNDGIVFLMAVPYVLVGIAAYAVYRIYKKKN